MSALTKRLEPVLKVKRLSENAFLPVRGTLKAAGYDLSSAYSYCIPPRGKELVKTDLAFIIPEGHYGRIGKTPRKVYSNLCK